MEEELLELLKTLRDKGATKDQLVKARDMFVDEWNKKNNKKPKGVKTQQSGGLKSVGAKGGASSSDLDLVQGLKTGKIKIEKNPLGTPPVNIPKNIPQDNRYLDKKAVENKKAGVIPMSERNKRLSEDDLSEDVKLLNKEGQEEEAKNLKKVFYKKDIGLTTNDEYQKEKTELVTSTYDKLANRPDYKYEPINRVETYFDEKLNRVVQVENSKPIKEIFGDLSSYGYNIEDVNSFVENTKSSIKKRHENGYFATFESDEEKLALKDFDKLKLISDYTKDRINYLRGKYLGLSKKGDKENAKKVLDEMKNTFNSYKKFYDSGVPNYKKIIQEKNTKEYLEYKESKNLGSFLSKLKYYDKKAKEILQSADRGLLTSAGNIGAFFADLLGDDEGAEEQRLINQFNESTLGNSLNYVSKTGKKVNYNGTNYVVTEYGEIIDDDSKKNITSIIGNLGINKKEIYKKASTTSTTETSFSTLGALDTVSQIVGDMVLQRALTKGVGSAVGATSKIANVATSAIVQGGILSTSVYEETLRQLKENGVDENKAKEESYKLSIKMGLFGVLTGAFSPNLGAMGITSKGVDKILVKELAKSYVKGGTKSALNKSFNYLKQKGYDITKDGFLDVVQEFSESFVQKGLNKGVNEEIGANVLDTKFSKDELIETTIVSFGAPALMASMGGKNLKDELSMLDALSKDLASTTKIIEGLKQEGAISEDTSNNIINDVTNYAKFSNKVPKETSLENLKPLFNLLNEREQLEIQKKTLDKAFHKEINIKLTELDNKIVNFGKNNVDAKNTQDNKVVTTIPVSEISQDPKRFQYKSDVDPETGVSDIMKGKKWERDNSGVISVWVDPKDNKTYVINGHHRLNLAIANDIKEIDVRYIEAKNESDARIAGAIQNISEGKGTDVDAAKVFIEADINESNLKEKGLNISDNIVNRGLSLSKLSKSIFDAVVRGDITSNIGVVIGNNIDGYDKQEQFYSYIKGKNLKLSTIEVMAQDLNTAPTKKEVVTDLFGETELEKAEYENKASFIASVRGLLSKAKNTLGKTAKSKDFLEQFGNKIDKQKSQGASQEAAVAVVVFDQLRNSSKEIQNIINESLTRIKNGESKTKVQSDAAKEIISISESIIQNRDVQKESDVNDKTIKESFKDIANNLRKLKTTPSVKDKLKNLNTRPTALLETAWDISIEIAASTIQETGNVAQAVSNGLKALKESKWYENLSSIAKIKAEQLFKEEITSKLNEYFDEKYKNILREETTLDIAKRKIKRILDKGRNRTFGFLNDFSLPIVQEVEMATSMLSNEVMKARESVKAYQKSFKKAVESYSKKYNVSKDEAIQELSDYVKMYLSPKDFNVDLTEIRDKIKEISPELLLRVDGFRYYIDNLSLKMLEDPAFKNLSDDLKKKIESNLGNYLKETYEFFKNKNYKPTEDVLKDAIRAEALIIQENNNDISWTSALKKADKTIRELYDKWESDREKSLDKIKKDDSPSTSASFNTDSLKRRIKNAQNRKLWQESFEEATDWYDKLDKKGLPNTKKNRILEKTAEIYEERGGTYEPLPLHLKKILGRIEVPEQRFLDTVYSSAQIIYQSIALNKVLELYEGSFIFDKKPKENSKDFVKLDSEKYRNTPFYKKWVHRDIIREFEQKPLYEADNLVEKAWFSFVGLTRMLKILPNPATWVKNVFGFITTQLVNGVFVITQDPFLTFKSYANRAGKTFTGNRSDFVKEIYDIGARGGVLSTGVNASLMGEFDLLHQKLNNSSNTEADLKSFFNALSKIVGKKVPEKIKNVRNNLAKHYSQIDDYSKSLTLYMLKDEYSKMIFGKEYDTLTLEQQNEVLKKAGNDVKRGTPTFSRLPYWFRHTAKVPVFGDFLSFTVASWQSFFGAGKVMALHGMYAKNGIDQNGNKLNDVQKKAYRKSFTKRLIGLSSVVASDIAIRSGAIYVAAAFIRKSFGWDDEEEDKNKSVMLIDTAKKLRPFWTDDSIIITDVDKLGNVTFFDYGGTQPYADITGALFYGNFDPYKDMLKPNMATEAILQSYEGETAFGSRIYSKQDGAFSKLLQSTINTAKLISPPLGTSYYYGIKKELKEKPNFNTWDLVKFTTKRLTIRDYKYDIYKQATGLVWEFNSDGYARKLGEGSSEKEVLHRLETLDKVREAFNVCKFHYSMAGDSKNNEVLLEKISKLEKAITRNFKKEEIQYFITSDPNTYYKNVKEIKNNIDKYYEKEED